jgi:hypothetical protein
MNYPNKLKGAEKENLLMKGTGRGNAVTEL